MKPVKSLILKTYGKQRRKLSAWISPEDRKQAFDSSNSTDGDVSVFEPRKPARQREKNKKKASTASRRAVRPARKKAVMYLMEMSRDSICSDENLIPSSPPPPQAARQSKTTRGRKMSVCGRPIKRKALCLSENSSDEENISRASPPRPLPAQQSKTTRRSQLVSAPGVAVRQKGQQALATSKSEKDPASASKCLANSVEMKRESNVHPPSVGRFVTRRRRGAAAKPKPPKTAISILDSSDDFISGAFRSIGKPRPSKRRRRPPPAGVSSVESSMNAAGASGFAANALREISLNESADHSLLPCSRKPMFCSTPSAGSLSKRPQVRLFPISDKSSASPSTSVSCIGAPSPLRKHLDSPGPLVSPLPSEERPPSSPGERSPDRQPHEDPSADLFTDDNKRSSCGDEAESGGGGLPSLNPPSTDCESTGDFVSAAGGLEWLIEVLKEKCLTELCTVRLRRFDGLAATQLCGQTTYSSCLGQASADRGSQPTNEHPSVSGGHTAGPPRFSEASLRLNLSVTNSSVRSATSFESSGQAASVTDTLDDDSVRPTESSAEFDESENGRTRITDESGDLTRSGEAAEGAAAMAAMAAASSSPAQSGDPEREALTAMLKQRCLSDELSVEVKRLSLSQLKEILQLRDKKDDRQSESDANLGDGDTSAEVGVRKRSSASSEDRTASDREGASKSSCDTAPKRKKKSPAPRERKRRSVSADRPGTTRKACVSGLSVSRWRNKGAAHAWAGGARAADCSIIELISTQHKQPRELGTAGNFSTPAKASRLNLSSLLADFTPTSTHTWSRLKAALSVHRKVLLTPRSLHLSGSPGGTALADLSQDLFASHLRTPLSKHLREQLYHDSPVVCEDTDLSDAEKVYAECGQQHPLPWEECILPHRMKRCVKIGEGTFGEVFSTTNASGDTVALKIIPLEGSEKVNGEDQKSFGEILHEIIISKELSSLKQKQHNQTCSFIGLNDLHCVQGGYPPDFLKAWDTFDRKKGSENDRPDFFEKDQLFIILEFEFGGIDLENSNGTLASLGVAKSILHQVTAALAVAEQELHFEHRDLHWGNVLVKTTRQKTGSFLLNGASHSFETKGVLVRIIDYSLSRLEIDDLTVSCDISKDEELFMGQGDYQFDVYRLMRQENGNNWSDFHPHTNVLWLHYLCSKLLSMKYRGSRGRGAKDIREELTRFYDNVLQYSSATEALRNCPMFQ